MSFTKETTQRNYCIGLMLHLRQLRENMEGMMRFRKKLFWAKSFFTSDMYLLFIPHHLSLSDDTAWGLHAV